MISLTFIFLVMLDSHLGSLWFVPPNPRDPWWIQDFHLNPRLGALGLLNPRDPRLGFKAFSLGFVLDSNPRSWIRIQDFDSESKSWIKVEDRSLWVFANERFSAVQFHAPEDTQADGGMNAWTNLCKHEAWWASLVNNGNDAADISTTGPTRPTSAASNEPRDPGDG